jgi:hypothetical protein
MKKTKLYFLLSIWACVEEELKLFDSVEDRNREIKKYLNKDTYDEYSVFCIDIEIAGENTLYEIRNVKGNKF